MRLKTRGITSYSCNSLDFFTHRRHYLLAGTYFHWLILCLSKMPSWKIWWLTSFSNGSSAGHQECTFYPLLIPTLPWKGSLRNHVIFVVVNGKTHCCAKRPHLSKPELILLIHCDTMILKDTVFYQGFRFFYFNSIGATNRWWIMPPGVFFRCSFKPRNTVPNFFCSYCIDQYKSVMKRMMKQIWKTVLKLLTKQWSGTSEKKPWFEKAQGNNFFLLKWMHFRWIHLSLQLKKNLTFRSKDS